MNKKHYLLSFLCLVLLSSGQLCGMKKRKSAKIYDLNDLPVDCLDEIFGYLTGRTDIDWAMEEGQFVCKEWRKHLALDHFKNKKGNPPIDLVIDAYDIPDLDNHTLPRFILHLLMNSNGRRVNLSFYNGRCLTNKKFAALIKVLREYVESVDLEGCFYPPLEDTQLDENSIKALSKCPYLKGIKFDQEEDCDRNGELTAGLAGHLSGQLEELYLGSDYNDFDDYEMENIGKMKELRVLDMRKFSTVTPKGAEHLTNLENLRVIHINSVSENEEAVGVFKNIGKIESLEEVYLRGGEEGADAVRYLKDLENLRVLELDSVGFITDEGCRYLSQFKSLESLLLDPDNGDNISERGFYYLSQIPKLRKLKLSRLRVLTEKGLMNLANAKGLKELRIFGEQITERVLDVLTKNLKNLEVLQLGGCRLAPGAFKLISRLKNLKSLRIQQCFIQDEGLTHLANMPSLKEFFCIYSVMVEKFDQETDPTKLLGIGKRCDKWRSCEGATIQAHEYMNNLQSRGINVIFRSWLDRHLNCNSFFSSGGVMDEWRRDWWDELDEDLQGDFSHEL